VTDKNRKIEILESENESERKKRKAMEAENLLILEEMK